MLVIGVDVHFPCTYKQNIVYFSVFVACLFAPYASRRFCADLKVFLTQFVYSLLHPKSDTDYKHEINRHVLFGQFEFADHSEPSIDMYYNHCFTRIFHAVAVYISI